jgi:phosphatidylglycerophosphate synthase
MSTATSSFEFKNAKREHHSVLAAAEKRALVWFAQRIPLCINSDHLTALGFLAMIMAALSYWYARWNHFALLAVIFWLAINWFGDSLDGTLARVRNRLRPRYGFYLDHIIDAFGMAFLFAGIAASGYMSWPVAMVFLIIYFMLCIEIYLATYTVGKFHLSFAGFGPTELRILLATGNITLLYRPIVHLWGNQYLLFDVGGTIAAIGIAVVLLISTIKNTRTLYLEERLDPIPNPITNNNDRRPA